jgi:LPXTG-motif cell wall-anchored protein
MPIVVVVGPELVSPIVDGDTMVMLMLVVLAAGVGWFLWRRK